MDINNNENSLNNQKEVLEILKKFYHITWEDDVTKDELLLHINNGIIDIDDKSGKEFDYTKSGKHQELLSNYVMYARSGALDEFYKNYNRELLYLQLKVRASNYATSE